MRLLDAGRETSVRDEVEREDRGVGCGKDGEGKVRVVPQWVAWPLRQPCVSNDEQQDDAPG
mgnify:FL=1